MSAAFERAWVRTGRAEGGYSNHPSDPGGETMWGITARVARAQGYDGPMRDLPKEKARQIAKVEYWDILKLDEIAALNEAIASELFDTNFNMWRGAAGKFLQRALNAFNRQERDYDEVEVDGEVGARTIRALEAYLAYRDNADGVKVMLRCLNAQQCADYLRQTQLSHAKEDFMFGWVLHRVVI